MNICVEEVIAPIDTADISNRSFEQYLDIFALNSNALTNKTVLDLAGGFSTFTNRVNQIYGNTGTTCRSLDASYTLLADLGESAEISTFNNAVYSNTRRSGGWHYSNGVVNYDTALKDKTAQEVQTSINSRFKEMHKERMKIAQSLSDASISDDKKASIIDNLPQVAGSAYDLPFKSDSFDLIVSSNFLLYPLSLDKPQGKPALLESLRVLNKDGELRIWPPGYFRKQPDGNLLYVSDTLKFDEENQKIIYQPFIVGFNFFSEIQKNGHTMYFVENDATDMLVIIKGDRRISNLSGSNLKVRKLNFIDSVPTSGIVLSESVNFD